MNVGVSHQELQQDAQVARRERKQEGTQTAEDDLHAGPALGAALAGLPKSPDGPGRTVDHHQRGPQEPEHQQADDDRRAPSFLRKAVEAVEVRLLDLPQARGGPTDRRQHQHPDPDTGPQGHFGRTQLLGFERVADGPPPVHSDAHDGVDAAIYPAEIQALQHRAEGLEVGGPEVVGGVNFEGKREEEEHVHQSQAGHVDR